MTTPGEHHQLTHVAYSPPILSAPVNHYPYERAADEPAVDLKAYFNTF